MDMMCRPQSGAGSQGPGSQSQRRPSSPRGRLTDKTFGHIRVLLLTPPSSTFTLELDKDGRRVLVPELVLAVCQSRHVQLQLRVGARRGWPLCTQDLELWQHCLF